MSSSESEDDFESASEGDDSSSYEEDDDEASDNEDQLVLSSAIPVDQTQEVKLAHSVDNNVVTSSLLENVSTQDEKQTEPPVPTTERPSTFEERSDNTLQHLDVKVQDKTAAAALTTTNSSSNSLTSSADEISPNNTKQPAEVQETVVLAKSLELVSISSSVQDQIRKSENIPSEIQEPIQSSPLDDAIPVDIVTKISTRSVSSRVRPSSNSKPKQTLGAKKLGGVKLSQPFENNATAPLDHDTEESLFPTKVEKAPHQTHQVQTTSTIVLISYYFKFHAFINNFVFFSIDEFILSCKSERGWWWMGRMVCSSETVIFGYFLHYSNLVNCGKRFKHSRTRGSSQRRLFTRWYLSS